MNGENLLHQNGRILTKGAEIKDAKAAMIMIHGRGATAEDILSLTNEFNRKDIYYVAPQAVNYTWYPKSFLAPVESNEPWLTSALNVVDNLVNNLLNEGFESSKIFLLGFSQGACLTLEYAARNPKKYGGIFGLSGGVIGPIGTVFNFKGNMEETPVFLGCSDIDFHIPVERVHETETVMKNLNAKVEKRIYPQMGHTIIEDEIDFINSVLGNI